MSEGPSPRGEAGIIQTYFAPLAAGVPGAFGLEDDCALLSAPDGHEVVLSTDPLIESVHFLKGDDAADTAWRAVAVNVSDVVAKGAQPLHYLCALALPCGLPESWLARFAHGLSLAQERFGCKLIGGDLDRTPGLLTVAVTMVGAVPRGTFVRRGTALSGDIVFVSGTIGDAGLGLRLRLDPSLKDQWSLDDAACARLIDKSLQPEPPIGLVAALRDFASAATDVSDGLAKDFMTLCAASGVGGRVEGGAVPISGTAAWLVDAGYATRRDLVTSGDDYEVLAAVPAKSAIAFEAAAVAAGVAVHAIGGISEPALGVAVEIDGEPISPQASGWDHFARGVDER